jgi:hypothetical protein
VCAFGLALSIGFILACLVWTAIRIFNKHQSRARREREANEAYRGRVDDISKPTRMGP